MGEINVHNIRLTWQNSHCLPAGISEDTLDVPLDDIRNDCTFFGISQAQVDTVCRLSMTGTLGCDR